MPVNQHRFGDQGPLHWAAGSGNCEAVKVLLDNGVDVNILDVARMTPLQVAIEKEPLEEFPAAKLLIRHGAALESRNEFGETAVMLASKRGNSDLVGLLDEAGADLRASDFASWTCLHFAADYGHLEMFVWLVSRGLQLHVKNSLGRSAIEYASFNDEFSSFLLSFMSLFDEIEAFTFASPGSLMNWGPAWLKEHFKMYLRRLGLERLRAWANLEPTDSWSPLCILSSIGQTLAVTNVLRLGADVDFEGSPHGSALMAACSSGHLESVKILVRHGAAISYIGKDGIRSAVDTARNHKAVLAWLLVDRFSEQGKLSSPGYADPATHSTGDVKPWSGIVKKELIITGTAERQVHESARSYWARLMAVRRGWRGKIVDQNSLVQTRRPSRLTPDEPVRVCPGDYGTPKGES